MKIRRQLLAVLGTSVLLSPRLAFAQPAQKIQRVAVLSIGTGTRPDEFGRWRFFVEAMRELNYVEGRNVAFLWGFGGGDFSKMPEHLANFAKAGADVIVATGTREIRAAKQATSAIPIVMTHAVDPVKEGFVASLARPGGNVTGLTSLIPGLSQKYVELLREAIPSAARLAVVAVPPNPIPEIRKEFEAAAQVLGVSLFFVQPSGPADFDRAFASAKKQGAAGIIHPLDGATGPIRVRQAFARSALKHKLPGIYWDAAYVDDGGLMSYSINVPEQYRRATLFVDKVLRGSKPADLPVEQPARIELVVNLKTAKALGVTIPQSILLRADRVID